MLFRTLSCYCSIDCLKLAFAPPYLGRGGRAILLGLLRFRPRLVSRPFQRLKLSRLSNNDHAPQLWSLTLFVI